MRRIQRLFWRPDRVEHILERLTTEEVEEALFDDPRGLLLRVGPAERDPDEMLYRYLGRWLGATFVLL